MSNDLNPSMAYQQLGSSDLQVSRIGFGCMSLHPGQTDFANMIDRAIGSGINYFDTADLYDKGLNESELARALGNRRRDVIIATKGGNQWRPDGSGWDWNPRKKYLLAAAEQSLQRLRTDYIDLYQLHGGTIDDPIDETIEAFEQLKQQGKIRFYGISSIRPNVIREYLRRSNIVSVMMQYSLADRRAEEECLDLLQQHTIGVLVRGSVAGGLLAGKPPTEYLNYSAAEIAKAAAAVRAQADATGSAATTAIQFVLQHPAVTAAVVGMRTAAQLSDALDAVRNPPLAAAQMSSLKAAIPVNVYDQHR